MRILFVNQYYAPDYAATAQQLGDLCEFLASEGHEIHVLAGTAFYDGRQLALPPYEILNGVHVHRVSMPHSRRERIRDRLLGYLGFYWRAFIRVHTVPRPDIIVTLTTPPLISLLGAWLKILFGTRFVFWVMDIYPDIATRAGVLAHFGPTRGIWSTLARFAYYCADRVVVLGRDMADVLAAKQVDEQRIVVIRSWAIGDEVVPIEHAENSFRDKHCAPGDFVVMYSGNMGTCHLYKEIVDCAEMLHTDPSIRFLFIGGGKLYPKIREALENEQPRALFLPYQPRERLAASLSAADVHLISLNETFDGLLVPSKVYGCMASGRPSIMIGSRKSEAARLLLDNECGLVVPPGDGEALRGAVLFLRENPEDAERMGRNAREAFLNSYERKNATANFAAMLEEVSAEKGHRRIGPIANSLGRVIFSPGGRPLSSWAFGLRARDKESLADWMGAKPLTLMFAVLIMAWAFWQVQAAGRIEAWHEGFRQSGTIAIEKPSSVPSESLALLQATSFAAENVFPPNRLMLNEFFRRQVALAPMESGTWLNIARQRIMEGRIPQARAALNYADTLNPAYPSERLDAVQHWALIGERDRARSIALRIARLDFAGRLEAGDALVTAGFKPVEVFEQLDDDQLAPFERANLAVHLMTGDPSLNRELFDFLPDKVLDDPEARAKLIRPLTYPMLPDAASEVWRRQAGGSPEGGLLHNGTLQKNPFEPGFYLGWQLKHLAASLTPRWIEPARAGENGILVLESPSYDSGGTAFLYRLVVPANTPPLEFSLDLTLSPHDAIDCRLVLFEREGHDLSREYLGDWLRRGHEQSADGMSAVLPPSSEPRLIDIAFARTRRAPAARGSVSVRITSLNVQEAAR